MAVIAQLHNYIGHRVDIRLPGGILTVEWDGVGEVLLSGPAEVVFTGEWLDEAPSKIILLPLLERRGRYKG